MRSFRYPTQLRAHMILEIYDSNHIDTMEISKITYSRQIEVISSYRSISLLQISKILLHSKKKPRSAPSTPRLSAFADHIPIV